jgi:hypothetical protein
MEESKNHRFFERKIERYTQKDKDFLFLKKVLGSLDVEGRV